MRYLMFTGNDGRTEIMRYSDNEVAEVFGKDAAALNAQGFFLKQTGIWVDMEREAKKRTAQIKTAMAVDD
jgi:hypothetical protein